jgi:CHAD domain-containing protein
MERQRSRIPRSRDARPGVSTGRAAPAWQRQAVATTVLRRLLLLMLDEASAQLRAGNPDTAAIHQLRRSIKRARALTLLLRGAVTRHSTDAMGEELADIARPWGVLRDAQVSRQLLAELRAPAATGPPPRESTAPRVQLCRRTRRRLAECRSEVEGWSVTPGGWEVVGKSLRRAWRRARTMLPPDIPGATPQALHRWRRRVKVMQNELLVLTPLHDEAVLRLLRDLGRLGDLLGREHDLAVLAAGLRCGRIRTAPSVSRRSILAVIRNERRRLRGSIEQLGVPLFARSEQQLERRLHRRWRCDR